MKIDPTPGTGVRDRGVHKVCNIDTSFGIFPANGRTPKSKIGPLVSLTPPNINDVGYFVSLELVDRALERLEIFAASSSNANLPLKSTTSVATLYRLLAIKCVRSHPRFSYRHAETFDKPVKFTKVVQRHCFANFSCRNGLIVAQHACAVVSLFLPQTRSQRSGPESRDCLG